MSDLRCWFYTSWYPTPCSEGVKRHSNQKPCTVYSDSILTPSLPQPVKFPGWKVHKYMHGNGTFDGPITNLLSVLCVLIETFHAIMRRRKKTKKHWWFQMWHFYWSFSEWRRGKRGSERVKQRLHTCSTVPLLGIQPRAGNPTVTPSTGHMTEINLVLCVLRV